jgi:hypothetical protein
MTLCEMIGRTPSRSRRPAWSRERASSRDRGGRWTAPILVRLHHFLARPGASNGVFRRDVLEEPIWHRSRRSGAGELCGW